jgi:hypothetical protein
LEAYEFEYEGLSDTDRQGFPDDPAEQLNAFDEAIATLRENRQFFDWVVNQLITDHFALWRAFPCAVEWPNEISQAANRVVDCLRYRVRAACLAVGTE